MSGEHDVKLHMYDLSKGMAKALAPMLGSWLSKEDLDGVWHTGVVVFGQEYYFNGDLVHVPAGETSWGEPTKVLTLGHTGCSREDLHEFVVSELRSVFNRSSYDALRNNCNHFADRLCIYLCQRHIPHHIIEQAEKLVKLPALRMLRPFIDQWLGGGSDDPQISNITGGSAGVDQHLKRSDMHQSSQSKYRQSTDLSPQLPIGARGVRHDHIGYPDVRESKKYLQQASPTRELDVSPFSNYCQEVENCSPSRQPCWTGHCVEPKQNLRHQRRATRTY